MDPLTAKLRFKLRSLLNCAIILGLFIPLEFVFANLRAPWTAHCVTIAILFYLYFFVLDARAIGIKCPHCERYLASNTPWICGFCGENVMETDEFPFIHRCEHCQTETKTYMCHHRDCGKLIFLTEDKLELNYATCLNFEEGKSAEVVTDALRYEREKQELEHKLAMSELATKLDSAEQRRESAKKRGPHEEIEESFSKYFARIMGSEEYAMKRKAMNAEEYKDNPEMLKKADEVVDSWLRSRV